MENGLAPSTNSAVLAPQALTLDAYSQNLKTRLDMATVLLKSGMLPKRYTSAEMVLVACLHGAELGLSPLQAVNSVMVINGAPSVDAATVKAKIYEHGGDIIEEQWTAESCTLTVTRPGKTPKTGTYTLEDAKLAGLLSKDNWQRMPKAMLYARALSIAGRNQFADVLKGFAPTEVILDEVEATIDSGRGKRKVNIQVLSREGATSDSSPKAEHDPANDVPCYSYDLNKIEDAETKRKALEWIKGQTEVAEVASTPGVWLSSNRLPKLAKWEIAA